MRMDADEEIMEDLAEEIDEKLPQIKAPVNGVVHSSRTCGNGLCGNHTCENRTWGVRQGHTAEIVNQVISYLQSHPANYCIQMDTLLELIYQSYTEFNSVETLEFKAIIDPLDEMLRSLVDTDEEADEYMNVVFELCAAYERQSYIEGMKTGDGAGRGFFMAYLLLHISGCGC